MGARVNRFRQTMYASQTYTQLIFKMLMNYFYEYITTEQNLLQKIKNVFEQAFKKGKVSYKN